MSHRFVTGALAALFVLSPLHPVEAAARGQTAQGWAYLQGGIGRDEVEMLSAARPFYSLSIRTAAGGSGAWLSNVSVTIRDLSRDQPVFEGAIDGPWLLIDLPAGRYAISARSDDQVRTQEVTIKPHARRDCVLYFQVAGQEHPFRDADPDEPR